jgi:hypothetical protein
MTGVYITFGVIGLVVFLYMLFNWDNIKAERIMKYHSTEYRENTFKKIGKLYDKIGMPLRYWRIFAVEIHGYTLDRDANSKEIHGGSAEYFYVMARTESLAKATFLKETIQGWYIVDCNPVNKIPKLDYA